MNAVNQLDGQLPLSLSPQPSIFEVLAQEYLASGLRSAFQYLSNVLVSSNPRKYLWLSEHFDECYLLFDSVVQASHLFAYNASFAEKFYGLRRSSPDDGHSKPLSSKQRLLSLYFLTVWPYLKRKLDGRYADLRREVLDRPASVDSKSAMFVRIYSYLGTAYESINLLYQVRYAVSTSQVHSVPMRLSGLQLKTFAKDEQQTDATDHIGPLAQAAKIVARTLGLSLSVGAFLLQFLEFYYARDESMARISQTPIPRPPPQISAAGKAGQLSALCPICNKQIANDTALMTNGLVYCYGCIRAHIDSRKCCPTTGVPITLDHLIKLYPPDD